MRRRQECAAGANLNPSLHSNCKGQVQTKVYALETVKHLRAHSDNMAGARSGQSKLPTAAVALNLILTSHTWHGRTTPPSLPQGYARAF